MFLHYHNNISKSQSRVRELLFCLTFEVDNSYSEILITIITNSDSLHELASRIFVILNVSIRIEL